MAAETQKAFGKAFDLEESIEEYAQRQGVAHQVSNSAALQLCRSVVFNQLLRLLSCLLDLMLTRKMGHANLFIHFPVFMQTRIPPEVMAEMWDTSARVIDGNVGAELNAMNVLIGLLEDNSALEGIRDQPSMEDFSMKDALQDILVLLDTASNPVHLDIYNMLPAAVMCRAHYADLLQSVYCRAVQLRMLEKSQGGGDVAAASSLWNPRT